MARQKPEQPEQSEEYYRHGRRRHRDRISAVLGGVIIILVGILLFLANRGILSWDTWWQYLILGIGIILLIDSVIRYPQEGSAGFRFGRLIAGIVLIGVGAAFLLGAVAWWPLIIIVVGVVVVVVALLRPRQYK
jgi:hypothetical protein